jgi:hypothetical protein
MSSRPRLSALLLGAAGLLPAVDQPRELTVMPPLFQPANGQRLVPQLRVSSFSKDGVSYAQPSLVLGNKRIGFRELGDAGADAMPVIVIDGHKALWIKFWGGASGDNFGYPFKGRSGITPQLTTDQASGSITFTKPYTQGDGTDATFTMTLRPAGAGQVELAWDLGVAQDKLDANPKAYAGVAPWMGSDALLAPLAINGLPIHIDAQSAPGGTEHQFTSGQDLEVAYEPAAPLTGFTLRLPHDYQYQAKGQLRDGTALMCIQTGSGHLIAKDRMVIDFGLAAPPAADAPPAVAGIDFHGQDRTCVPQSTTRNLMPNPSFEQGLRYWNWWHNGGGHYAPGEEQRFSIASGGAHGQQSLRIRRGKEAMSLQSFTVPVVKGRTYSLSFQVKGDQDGGVVHVGLESPLQGSALTWMTAFKDEYQVTSAWTRHSRSFTADVPAISIVIETQAELCIDAIQLEEGAAATDFVAPAVAGALATADPDGNLALGQPVAAVFTVRGAPGATGEAAFRLRDFFHDTRSSQRTPFTLDATGTATIPLPIEAAPLGTGVFVLQADLQVAGSPLERDFYRFSIMPFLENRHATKDLFGSLNSITGISRGADLGRNYMRWGFGSTTYGSERAEQAELLERFRVRTFLMTVGDLTTGDDRVFADQVRHELTSVTPEQERRIEALCFNIASSHPWGRSWAFGTETEGSSPMILSGRYDEFAKVQLATLRGIKRARPDAIVLPDGGTSGYCALRGHRETEGYLTATQGKATWDAIAIHPYGDLDGVHGTYDLDVELQRLRDQMARHGYGTSTPIDLTEGYNECPLRVQEWNTSCNDYYDNGKPTYDFGWKEYLQACWAARSYIMCLKHWPQVRSFNIWLDRVTMDLGLAPLAVCKVPNTLGNLLGEPAFTAEVKPAAGVRGYVFTDALGRGVAALWCTSDRVDDGLEAGPALLARLTGPGLEFIDLMGCARRPAVAQGVTTIPLGSAPLFIRCPAGGATRLAAELDEAAVSGAASSLQVAVRPGLDGAIEAVASNLTGRPLRGTLQIAGETIPFDIAAKGTSVTRLKGAVVPAPGRLFPWTSPIGITLPGGHVDAAPWDMQFLYVPHAASPLPADPAAAAWAKIPAIPLTNWSIQHTPDAPPVAGGQAGDLDARVQVAWDKDNLYLRVACVDDRFVVTDPARFTPSVGGSDPQLYKNDGCVELYLDTAANGRSNAVKGFDQDDYRYDFAPGNPGASDGPGAVYRLREVYHQLAGGIDMPTKDAAAQGITCQFRRTGGTYAYVMILPQRFIEPLKLEKGWRAGLGLFVHDNDSPERQWPGKGLSLATAPGAHCDARPDLWPLMILAE